MDNVSTPDNWNPVKSTTPVLIIVTMYLATWTAACPKNGQKVRKRKKKMVQLRHNPSKLSSSTVYNLELGEGGSNCGSFQVVTEDNFSSNSSIASLLELGFENLQTVDLIACNNRFAPFLELNSPLFSLISSLSSDLKDLHGGGR